MKQLTITTNGHEFLLVEVPKDATNFIIDHGMEYVIYKIPNYKNWCTDEILGNYGKLQKYLKNAPAGEDWLTTGFKYSGKGEILGLFTPSTGENTTELPTELLHSETTKAYPLKENPHGDYLEFVTVRETSNIREVNQSKHNQWLESESKVMPSRLLVIKVK